MVGWPAAQADNASASFPPVATGVRPWSASRACLAPYPNRGSIRQCIGTRPEMPSTRRASSRAGASPQPGNSMASLTRTAPSPVTNVVSSTLVAGT
jgi:hypothetical protein